MHKYTLISSIKRLRFQGLVFNINYMVIYNLIIVFTTSSEPLTWKKVKADRRPSQAIASTN